MDVLEVYFVCLANFSLPEEEDSPFKEIVFAELDRDQAKEVVDLYNKVIWLPTQCYC